MNNNWKIIPGLESYSINEDGVVKALPKIREGRLDCLNNHNGVAEKSRRHYKERIIKPKYTSRYWYVNLTHNGIKKNYRVHRLVYRAFIGNIPEDMVIDHIDGDRNNNNISNLRCVSISENCQNPNTKYNRSRRILQIDPNTNEVIGQFNNMTDAIIYLGKQYEPKMSAHIGDCCKGRRRTALGYSWQYEDTWLQGIHNIKADRVKPIVQYDLDGNFIAEYKSIKEASDATGCTATNIVKCAKGKILKPRKFIWKYKRL